MKKPLIFIGVIALFFIAFGIIFYSGLFNLNEKIYVAVEGDGKIAVIDPVKNKVKRNISLVKEHGGSILNFNPHNVQVAPNGETVWVTANAGSHDGGHSFNFINNVFADAGHEESGLSDDEVIVINPKTDLIIKRIPVAVGIHLAHVVLTPDSAYAYVTAQKEGVIYKINASTYEIDKKISLPDKSEPHGIRIASDGSVAYLAMLGSKALGILDISKDTFSEMPLRGKAVQAGVTPDGNFAFVSLYDTKELAVYKKSSNTVDYVALPTDAKGPIQMYPTNDSRFVYLADQGYYFNQPSSDMVYKIDLMEMKVVKEIKAGKAPHGVVVSKDGKFVYVTNLLSGDVSVINALSDSEIARIAVGKEPNGISIWNKELGGTP